MNLGSLRFSVVVAILCTLFTCPAARAKSFPINLDRATKLGGTYGIECSLTITSDAILNDGVGAPTKQHNKIVSALAASIRVLEIDRVGSASKLEFTIVQLIINGAPGLDPGSKVVAEIVEGKEIYAVDGNPVDPQVGKVLALLSAPHHADRPTDDALAGTRERREVGATWSVDPEAMADGFAAGTGGRPSKENLKGTVKLVSLKTINGREYLEVEAHLLVEALKSKAPDGTETDDGRIDAVLTKMTAADGSGEIASELQTVKSDQRIKGKTLDNKKLIVQLHTEMVAEIKYKLPAEK